MLAVLRPREMELAALPSLVVRPWLFFATAMLAACGGSSSETPPPLSPDPLHAAYRPESDVARAAGNRKQDAKAEPPAADPSAGAADGTDSEKPRPGAE